MPDVAELLSELDGLSERPPAAPRPVAEIRERARRRRHRRRLQRTGLAAAALAAVVTVAVVTLGTEDGGSDVDLGPVATPSDPDAAPPTTVDGDGVVRVLEGRGLTLDPAEGFDDGDRVTLMLTADPSGSIEVTQCAAEVVSAAGSLDPSASAWCGSVFHLRDLAGTPDMGFEVDRRLATAHGTVDCAAASGRCVLVARPMTPSGPSGGLTPDARAADARAGDAADAQRYAPLVFRDDLPPPPEPEARLVDAEGPLEDGQVLRLEASGFDRVADVMISQCTGPVDGLASASEGALAERCDAVRFARIRADGAGSVTADVRVFHDIGLVHPTGESPTPTWEPCSPCSLVVHDRVAPESVVLPLGMAPADDPIRPVLRVSPPGPHQVGQLVRIEGTGFQLSADVAMGLCARNATPGEAPDCGGYPDVAFTTTDAEGSFVIDGYPLGGSGPVVAQCDDGPGACSLRWERDGRSVAAEVPLDVVG